MHAGSFQEEQKGSPQCLRDCGEKGASGNTRKKKGDIEKKTTKKMSGGKKSQLNHILKNSPKGRTLSFDLIPKENYYALDSSSFSPLPSPG